MTDLNLLQAIASGELLAVHRGVDYLRACLIFALPHDGTVATFYATESDWPASPIGEIAARNRTIMQQQHTIAELEARIAELTRVPQEIAAAATPMEAPTHEGEAVPCPECDRTFPSQKSLRMHRQRTHRGRAWSTRPRAPTAAAAPESATESAPPSDAPPTPPRIQLVEDNAAWRCDQCQTAVFARSLAQPDLCVRCAAKSAQPATLAA